MSHPYPPKPTLPTLLTAQTAQGNAEPEVQLGSSAGLAGPWLELKGNGNLPAKQSRASGGQEDRACFDNSVSGMPKFTVLPGRVLDAWCVWTEGVLSFAKELLKL